MPAPQCTATPSLKMTAFMNCKLMLYNQSNFGIVLLSVTKTVRMHCGQLCSIPANDCNHSICEAFFVLGHNFFIYVQTQISVEVGP